MDVKTTVTPQEILSQIPKTDLIAAADDVKVLLIIDWPKYTTATGKRIQSTPTVQLRDAYYALRWILGTENIMPSEFKKLTSRDQILKWWQSTQDEISRNALEFVRSTYRQSTSAKELALSRAGLGKGGELSPPSLGVYGLGEGDIKLIGQHVGQQQYGEQQPSAYYPSYPSAVSPFPGSISVPFVPPVFQSYTGPEESGSII
jgi:hypothetical protein